MAERNPAESSPEALAMPLDVSALCGHCAAPPMLSGRRLATESARPNAIPYAAIRAAGVRRVRPTSSLDDDGGSGQPEESDGFNQGLTTDDRCE